MAPNLEMDLLGIRLNPGSLKEILEISESMILERGHHIVGINAAKVVEASSDPKLLEVINRSSLVHADGVSIGWAAWFLGLGKVDRVAGIDFMDALVRNAATKRFRLFLLGAKEEVVAKVNDVFLGLGANVVGFRNGYWSKTEERSVIDEIARQKPDILLVAIPSPDKEWFVSKNLSELNCGLIIGVGGSFDVVAGVTRRAPKLLQKIGLEWLFRLLQEPRRMYKRYLVGNSIFIWLVIREKFFAIRSKKSS